VYRSSANDAKVVRCNRLRGCPADARSGSQSDSQRRAWGRGSGVQVQSPVGSVTDFREGRLWRIRAFSDHAAALLAAGLAE